MSDANRRTIVLLRIYGPAVFAGIVALFLISVALLKFSIAVDTDAMTPLTPLWWIVPLAVIVFFVSPMPFVYRLSAKRDISCSSAVAYKNIKPPEQPYGKGAVEKVESIGPNMFRETYKKLKGAPQNWVEYKIVSAKENEYVRTENTAWAQSMEEMWVVASIGADATIIDTEDGCRVQHSEWFYGLTLYRMFWLLFQNYCGDILDSLRAECEGTEYRCDVDIMLDICEDVLEQPKSPWARD